MEVEIVVRELRLLLFQFSIRDGPVVLEFDCIPDAAFDYLSTANVTVRFFLERAWIKS